MQPFLDFILQAVRPCDSRRRVVWDDSGFRIELNALTISQCNWRDVIEVYAFKFDLWGWDEICLGFRGKAEGDPWVGEEDLGYPEFEAHVQQRFPGIRNDWFHEVAFPAFVTNRTTLWGDPPVERQS